MILKVHNHRKIRKLYKNTLHFLKKKYNNNTNFRRGYNGKGGITEYQL